MIKDVKPLADSASKTVLKGTAILVAANFLVKIIGILYKVPLVNMISPLGMGYFSAAFEVQQVLLTISLALPLAVSKMISEARALGHGSEVRKIFRVVLISFSIIGLAGTLILYFGSGVFSTLISIPMAKYSIMALAPAMFFFSVAAIFRGLYQGLDNMLPTALTQITEALIKLAAGTGIAYMMIKMSYATRYVSAGAIFGTTLGTAVSLIVLVPIFFMRSTRATLAAIPDDGKVRSSKRIFKELIYLVIPITLGSFIVNLTSIMDLFFITHRLQYIGMSSDAATTAYGGYKNMAQLLFNLPPSIISSISLSIIPAIAAAHVLGDQERLKRILNSSLKIVILFAMPCAVGLFTMGGPIQHLLFPSQPDAIKAATPLLKILSVASLWACIATVTTAALQAVGRLRIPLISLAIGGGVKLCANYILVGTPGIGINGAPIGTNLCYITILCINGFYIFKYIHLRPNLWGTVIKPLFAGLSMGVLAVFFYNMLDHFIGNTLSVLATILFSGIVYFVFLFLFRCFSEDDILLLPKGRRILGLLKRAKLI